MRMFHIIVNGELVKTCPAYNTHLEVQHEMAVETGKFVRVVEFCTREPKVRREDHE